LEVVTWNLSWVTEALAVGGSFPVSRASALVDELAIRAVVDVRSECCDDPEVLGAHGIALLHLPARDLTALAVEMLDAGVCWIGERLDQGHKVFVHCEHGVGRSALLAWCVLVSRGDEPIAALERLKRARERVAPSPTQIDAFIRWAASFKRNKSAPWEIPTFDPLARVAYRHFARP
jgi:rhodanese-related sulfurtransferase